MLPHYVAPPMPWTAWRHMSDADLRAIAAYLKRGLKPVVNKVAESEGPPDFWASFMIPGEHRRVSGAGSSRPRTNLQPPAAQRARVVRGRALVIDHGCGDCHGGLSDPSRKGWLGGITRSVAGVRVRALLSGSKGAVLRRPAQEHHAGQRHRHRPMDGSAGLQRPALRTEA